MRLGLITSDMPFSPGGARLMAEWLQLKLQERGHDVASVTIPFTDETDFILPQMNAFRMIELDTSFDRVITLRPPAHLVRHRRKVVWFIHHLRVFYDLWDTAYRPFPDTLQSRALRDAIHVADTRALREAHKVFTNSRVVADRLQQFNGIVGDVLFPPIYAPGAFRAEDYGDEIVCVCRLERHKRQDLLIEAMRHTRTPVRLRLCGVGSSEEFANGLRAAVAEHGLGARVTIENRWISEVEKADRLAGALACVYIPFDEDSYGYSTIEAAHAGRGTVTVSDSGGVPDFVIDNETGLVVCPQAQALAAAFDRLFADRTLARRLGEGAETQVAALGIDWDTVIGKLLA